MPCYLVNYPADKRELVASAEDIKTADELYCKRVCNKQKTCNKHKCQEVCCPVKGKSRAEDPDGKHMCMIECTKKLSCGEH